MRVTAAFSRLLDLPGVWVRKVRFEPDRVIVWGRVAPQEARLPEVLLLDDGARERAGSRLGLAGCRSRPLAAQGPRPAAAAALPGTRRARGGRAIRPRRRPVHARLRGCRGLADDQDRQDRGLPADADRLGDGRRIIKRV